MPTLHIRLLGDFRVVSENMVASIGIEPFCVPAVQAATQAADSDQSNQMAQSEIARRLGDDPVLAVPAVGEEIKTGVAG
jgi:hypothetical protein